MSTTFFVYRDDDFHSNIPICSENIPALRTIIDNVNYLLVNNVAVRHSYLCVLRQTNLDNSPATQQEDEILIGFFLRRFPEVRLMEMTPAMLACIDRLTAPRRLYLNWQLAAALNNYNLMNPTSYMHNVIMLIVATLFHELAHLLWSDVHSPKSGTPPHFILPTQSFWSNGQLKPPPEWGESGLVVEGRLFEGILSAVYDPGYEGDFSRIRRLNMRRDLGGLYNEASFHLEQRVVGAKISDFLFMPHQYQPAFTLNDVTAVLPREFNPLQYPNLFTTEPNRPSRFFVRSRSATAWVPYVHGDSPVNLPLCYMAMEKEIVVA
ncbi:hypothetical protein PILCRDRAFT_826173 [Piloderma croceum F 1598]|uniref:Uncharacterized protein n=1 Tax=Piloderma croceum (strain F 1598) TaxID=765440 RepID=A0A0C3F9S1_PILCF|nr:hypothetical protein PILCRDRAFT_826173 [Piloderma croceum F 1598]